NVTGDVYLNDVANGRTDFIPNDYPAQKLFVDYMLSQNPNLNVKMSNVQYNPTEQGIVMNKKDDSLKKKIDAVIKDMIKDGSLKKISETYYAGQDLTKPFGKDKKIPVIDTKDVN
ncbi:TPA: transporter substrate-binding domain-containing protein, partial [Streptococcus pyogenes]|nr:transporter substrate-binding domain-containing protein [Streptococcus pyogenes]